MIRLVTQIASIVLVAAALLPQSLMSQAPVSTPGLSPSRGSIKKYYDNATGKTADEFVEIALANNGELAAMRKEAEGGEALIRQARLRANPSLEVSGTQEIRGMGDRSLMSQVGVPLELGGRRSARILVAEKELRVRQAAVAERERQLAADVRTKFGEALAAILKLKFAEETLAAAERNYSLVSERVADGRTPPLEQNQELVELNRIRSLREMTESAVETRLFELRNQAGMGPEEPVKLKGEFDASLEPAVPEQETVSRALQSRPDLVGARAVEDLSAARIEQARAEGRIDADVMVGYQRMKTGFPQLGIAESTGQLEPIENRMNFFTFGVKLMLPVRNRNQGMIAAAQLELQAARSRREFGELTIRREIASARARYDRTLRAREIYRVGVRDQAAANLGVTRQTYELGSRTLLDYIGELRRYIDTENGFIDAELDAYMARVELLKAANAPELTNKQEK